MVETVRETRVYQWLVHFIASLIVAWKDRNDIWLRIKKKIASAQPIILLFLLLMLAVVMAARIKLANDMRIEAEQREAAEVLRLDQEKQEAIRAQMVAAEQNKYREENEAVARILQTNAANLSEEGQRALVDFLWNRMEAKLYGDETLLEVCNRPSQFIAYTGTEPVVQKYYNIAADELDNLRSGTGYRTLPTAFLFYEWHSDSIIFRTSFEETNATQHWRVQ